MTAADMPSDWEEHAYPGVPEVRLLRAIYGLCPNCDHPGSAHHGDDATASHDCSMCPERIGKVATGEIFCLCGNEPAYDGFQPVLGDGTLVEPLKEGPWDGKLYLCLKCGRIVDQQTLFVVGKTRVGGDSGAW